MWKFRRWVHLHDAYVSFVGYTRYREHWRDLLTFTRPAMNLIKSPAREEKYHGKVISFPLQSSNSR